MCFGEEKMPELMAAETLSSRQVRPANGAFRATLAFSGDAPAVLSEALSSLEPVAQSIARLASRPSWQPEVVAKLCRLARLPVGWDSYQGQPLRLETGMFALLMLSSVMRKDTPMPHIIPV